MKVWIHDGKVIDRPEKTSDTVNPTNEQLAKAGYYCVEAPTDDKRWWIVGEKAITVVPKDEQDAILAAEQAKAEADEAARQEAIEAATAARAAERKAITDAFSDAKQADAIGKLYDLIRGVGVL